jgi:hypothetical protein
LLDPLTEAVNVFDWPEVSDADVGDTPIDTGTRDSVTLALWPVDAWLVAVIVTVSADGIGLGAV